MRNSFAFGEVVDLTPCLTPSCGEAHSPGEPLVWLGM
jgi:hypothetical protein